jgi:hypothetical protein
MLLPAKQFQLTPRTFDRAGLLENLAIRAKNLIGPDNPGHGIRAGNPERLQLSEAVRDVPPACPFHAHGFNDRSFIDSRCTAHKHHTRRLQHPPAR